MSGSKGGIVLKYHHSMGDWLALAPFMMQLNNLTDPTNIPLLKPIPWHIKLMIAVASPFYALKELGPLFFPPVDHNAICNKRILSGKKRGAFRKLTFNSLKAASKRSNCTLNDFVSSLIGVSLHDYFQKMKEDPDFKEFPIPNEVQLISPVSLREPVSNIEDIKVTNELSQLRTKLVITPDFEQTVKETKEYYKISKQLSSIYGVLSNIILSLTVLPS